MSNRLSGSSRDSVPPDMVADIDPALQGEGITPAYLIRAIRHNLPVFLVMVGLTLAMTALLVLNSRPQYSAKAAIRLASERRTLTSGVENAPQTLDRPVDPLLSAVQVLTSRTLVGTVIDSMGMRFQPISPFKPGVPLFGRRLPTGTFQRVVVVPDAPVDTMVIRFSREGVSARSSGGEAAARFGETLRLGPVQFMVPHLPPVRYTLAVIRERDVAIDGALKSLKVVPRPGTDVIDVKYYDADPATAQQFANRLARLFRSANGHSAQDQARRRREFLGEQLRVTDSMLVAAEAGLSRFRSKQEMGSSRDNLTAEQATALGLEAKRVELIADRRVYAALLQRVKDSGGEGHDAAFQALAYSPEIGSDTVLSQLQQRLITYRTRLDSLTTGPWRSLPTHPDVVQLTTLVQSTQSELIRAVRARLASIDARIVVLSNQKARGTESMQSLPARQAQEAGLDRRVQVLRTTADALRQEYQKARISEALGATDIEILDPASLPYRRAGVPRSVAVGIGLLIGLLFGLGTALLAEATNSAVRRPDELQTILGAAELGVIPQISQLNGNGSGAQLSLPGQVENGNGRLSGVVFDPSGALSPEAEAFRTLKMGLSFSWGDQPCTLVVTSAAPQEGKTLIASNLAATFARGGAQVLLVDCDIHRPRLHRLFHVSRTPGLMDLLRVDDSSLHYETARKVAVNRRLSAVRRTPIEGLYFLPCGADPQTTPELLEPARLRGLLRDLRAEFDVIVLDTPPVLVSADAATLAASADGVIMVIRAGQTDRGAAELARQRVTSAGGRVLGAVLNDADGVMSRFAKPYYAYDYPATVD
jgi:succinoglycan biosynthesis transport protein ExoP